MLYNESTRLAPLLKKQELAFFFFGRTMSYSKPYLDINQQIALLQSRGMVISNLDFAQRSLERVGYYRLSAYYYPYRISTNNPASPKLDDFQASTLFNQVMKLYDFDRKLRLLVMDAVEKIEIAVRASVTLELGKRGRLAHLDSSCLDGKFTRIHLTRSGQSFRSKHSFWQDKMDRKFLDSKEDFVLHFKGNYPQDKPPIWIACELWDFGMTSYLLEGLQYKDRINVAKYFNIRDPNDFCSWIRTVNHLRNICAHHSRLWNKAIIDQPKIPNLGVHPELDHIVALTQSHSRFYTSITVVAFLVKQIWPDSSWSEKFKILMSEFPTDSVVNIAQAGFPSNWMDESVWR